MSKHCRELRAFIIQLIIAFSLLSTGCFYGSFNYSPKTLKRGKFKVSGQGMMVLFTSQEREKNESGKWENVNRLRVFPYPILNLSLAYGFTDWLEAQVQLDTFGALGLGISLQIVDSRYFKLAGIVHLEGSLGSLILHNGGYLTFPSYLLGGIFPSENFSINFGLGYRPLFISAGNAAHFKSDSNFYNALSLPLGFEFYFTKNFGLKPQVVFEVFLDNQSTPFLINVALGVIGKF